MFEHLVKYINRIWMNQYYQILFLKKLVAHFVFDKLYYRISKSEICYIYIERLILDNDQINFL